MTAPRRYRVECDGIAATGGACSDVAEGELGNPLGPVPVPPGWTHLVGSSVVGSLEGDHPLELDLWFSTRGCQERWQAGAYADFLVASAAAP